MSIKRWCNTHLRYCLGLEPQCRFCAFELDVPKRDELNEEDAFRIASFGDVAEAVCSHVQAMITPSIDGMTLDIQCPECNASARVGIATYHALRRPALRSSLAALLDEQKSLSSQSAQKS